MSYQLPEGEKKYNFCGCQCGCPPETPAKPREFTCAAAKEPVRTIKVLDTEDATNRQLYQNVLEAVQLLGLSPEMMYITEPKKTSPYYTDLPAVIKDERAIAQGRICTVDELKELLQK
ncbi:MAG: hypothetical protein E7195_10030 [Peptococcaceae bacterium]|nr:hypothetical protein [Peptococcaceae bacterium]